MAVAFKRGSTTGPNDLQITVRDAGGLLIDPFRLEYAVYDATTGVEVLIGSPVNTPVHISLGKYYAEVVIAADGNIGDWRIRWTIQEMAADPVYQSVQEFNVVGDATIVSFTGDVNLDKLLYSLRIMLRDNNPDRNYHFRQPESSKFVQGQTQVFGFIWEDEELLEYLYMAVDDFNSRPPTTGIDFTSLWGSERRWRTTVILRAAAFACFAIAMNWIADEFSVSGREKVRVKAGGKEILLSLKELYEIVHRDILMAAKREVQGSLKEFGIESSMEIKEREEAEEIRKAFIVEELLIQSYNTSENLIEWKSIYDVSQHIPSGKRLLKVSLETGISVTVTEDHSLFRWEDLAPTSCRDLRVNDLIVTKDGTGPIERHVISVEEAPAEDYVYDLSVPGTENFFLESGILAHNTYSISGVSLDIEKSSKYQSMKDEYIAEYDKLVEAAKRSIKVIKGLRQLRYGVGITSALGPLNRPGVQSRRNWIEPSRPMSI